MSNKNFIVIEGVDGSGKTTIAKLLSEKLFYLYYKTPGGFWKRYRELFEKTSVKIRFLYYFFSTLADSLKIKLFLQQKGIVCDRYIYSTWAHHIVYGLPSLLRIPYPTVFFKEPDYVFYLYVDPSERAQRIQLRTGNNVKDYDDKAIALVDGIFRDLFPEMYIIDTTNLTPEEVTSKILNIIKLT